MPKILAMKVIDDGLWVKIGSPEVLDTLGSPITLYTDYELENFKLGIKNAIRIEIDEVLSKK